MAVEGLGSQSSAVAFLVSAGVVYEVIAAAASSPQTTEINADKRAQTLMKWVYLGLMQGALFVVIAALIDKNHAKPIIAGGALAGAILWGSYVYAKQSGIQNPGPGTEVY